MKPARTWLPVLAFLVLSVLASLPAHSAISCDRICDCGVLCSTHCGPPATTCGASGRQCSSSPLCTDQVSTPSTWNAFSSKPQNLLSLIFNSSAPAPAAVPVSR